MDGSAQAVLLDFTSKLSRLTRSELGRVLRYQAAPTSICNLPVAQLTYTADSNYHPHRQSWSKGGSDGPGGARGVVARSNLSPIPAWLLPTGGGDTARP